MSQCAAVLNPGLPGQVLLYYLTENNQIALEHRSIDNSQYAKYTDNGTLPGYINTPGSFCAAVRQGVPYVYGFTKPKGGDEQEEEGKGKGKDEGKAGTPVTPATPETGKVSVISKVSPLYNPITVSTNAQTSKTATEFPGLAACSDSNATDFVYFVNKHTDSEANTIKKIYEASITAGTEDPNVIPMEKCTAVYGQSKLVAITLPGGLGRLVFFQDLGGNKKKELKYLNPALDGEPHLVFDTDTADHGTSIAVTYTGTDAGHTLFLYWVSGNNDLMRSIGTFEVNSWVWKQAQTITGAGYVEQHGAISAVCDGKHNHVFYKKEGGKEFSSYKDDLSNIKI